MIADSFEKLKENLDCCDVNFTTRFRLYSSISVVGVSLSLSLCVCVCKHARV